MILISKRRIYTDYRTVNRTNQFQILKWNDKRMDLVDSLKSLYREMSILELSSINSTEGSLSYLDMLYLDMIYFTDDCTPSHIADTLKVARSAVTIRLNKLMKKGMIERTKSQTDGRVCYIRLTASTRKDYDDFFEQMRPSIDVLENEFTPEQIELFGKMMSRLTTNKF